MRNSCSGMFLLIALIAALFHPVLGLAQFGENTQYFPHFALGGGWTTVFTIHNSSGTTADVQLQMFRTDGTIYLTRNVSLVAGGTQTVPLDASATSVTVGWAKLTSTGLFSGTAMFQNLANGRVTTEVGVLPAGTSDHFRLFSTVQSSLPSST